MTYKQFFRIFHAKAEFIFIVLHLNEINTELISEMRSVLIVPTVNPENVYPNQIPKL